MMFMNIFYNIVKNSLDVNYQRFKNDDEGNSNLNGRHATEFQGERGTERGILS